MLLFGNTGSGWVTFRHPEQPSVPLIAERTAVGIRCYSERDRAKKGLQETEPAHPRCQVTIYRRMDKWINPAFHFQLSSSPFSSPSNLHVCCLLRTLDHQLRSHFKFHFTVQNTWGLLPTEGSEAGKFRIRADLYTNKRFVWFRWFRISLEKNAVPGTWFYLSYSKRLTPPELVGVLAAKGAALYAQ